MDKVEIANLALSHIGMASINSMDEASEPARMCKQFYDRCRREVLRHYQWPFATKQVQLALLALTPPNYLYAYQYPTDCLYMRKLFKEDFKGLPEKNHYQVFYNSTGRVIYTNVENAYAEYTVNVEDANLYPDDFIQALAWKLAADISFKLTGNATIMQTCIQAYAEYMTEAETDNDNESNELNPVLDALALARFRG